MFKVGLSSKSNPISDELFSSFAAAGITRMEISNCSVGYAEIDFVEAQRLADKHGVMLRSLHLPFKTHDGIPHDISDPEHHALAVEDHKKLISKVVAETGVRIFVVHPSGAKVPEEARHLWMATCKESLVELVEYAKGLGAVIAVENMTHQCLGNTIAEFEELALSHPELCVCFDINHLLYESHAEFVRRLGKKIICLHVSDCDLTVEQHSLPGEGRIDFGPIISALVEVGYSGPWTYEVSYKIPQPEDDKYKLTCESFARNAEELFAGKAPSRQR
ncbi:MAG: sugar phosphate isomerase/epimerase [Clostridia bacterium]|nr:sugar phosphate isomerase/epimerase [Clostridia bacterium]